MENLDLIKSPEQSFATLTVEANKQLTVIISDIETRLVNIKRDVFEIGKLLSKAKRILPHGAFQFWIQKYFVKELPYSTAALYMKIYETFEKSPKTVQYLPISFLMQMTQSTFPEEIIKIISENVHIDKLDVNTIKDAYEKFKEKIIDLSEFEKITKNQFDLAVNMEWGRTEKRISENHKSAVRIGMKSIIEAIKKVKGIARDSRHIYPQALDEFILQVDLAMRELENVRNILTYKDNTFFKTIINKVTGRKELVGK